MTVTKLPEDLGVLRKLGFSAAAEDVWRLLIVHPDISKADLAARARGA
jgi:hypothetical protein